MSKITTSMDYLKLLFTKIFDPKVPFNRVIAVLLFLAFLISVGIYYLLAEKEDIEIIKAKEEIERN